MSSRTRHGFGLVVTIRLLAAACSSGSAPAAKATGPGAARRTTTPGTSVAASGLPDPIKAVMSKARYAKTTWSLLATDLNTGESFDALNPDQMSFTGATRKLFSVGTALNGLGADHRVTTPVYRTGPVDGGTLNGNLVLVGQVISPLAAGGSTPTRSRSPTSITATPTPSASRSSPRRTRSTGSTGSPPR